jgi:hypothetical protein
MTDLGYTALHNQEVGIVDIQLDTLKEILNRLLSRLVPVQKVFGYVGECNLSSLIG